MNPVIIEKIKRERESRESEARRVPLYAPRPEPPRTPREDSPKEPEEKRGFTVIDFTI
jgi:hypothetical protein